MARSIVTSYHDDPSSNTTRLRFAIPTARTASPSTSSPKQNKIPPFVPTITNMTKPHRESNNAPITTTNNILDYLLYLSIDAKIEQAKDDLQNLTPKVTYYRKKCQGVEVIVEGLLQSHRTQATSLILPAPLKHRLYLCQLLHLVYDRSKIISPPLKSTRTIHPDSTSTTRYNPAPTSQFITPPTNRRDHKLPLNLEKYEKYFKNPLLSRCRRHRLNVCDMCNQRPDQSPHSLKSTPSTRKTAPGLIDAVPVFINSIAIAYRLAHEKLEFEKNDPILVKSTWYDLLLDLLTQSAIECYFCDSYSSIDALLEIFSYGDIDPSDYHSDNSESEDDEDPHFAANRADDYLLWQRTTVLDEFRSKKKDRMEEFLNVQGKLEQHFANLAMKYPVCNLEAEMLAYCTNVLSFVDAPALVKLHTNDELFNVSGRYGDGIDIPMSEDEFDGSYERNSDSRNVSTNEKIQENLVAENEGTKKRHSLEIDQISLNKKQKS
ncbi:6490_t:CDS:2 [Acaulospora colombiana]|uniref:6490_t:CDS:1 n=1 Tax=Acaulospora colombiana TaxID=27376 RepID=A0ACA9JYG1_9GLOM|nr:6490_t:CDS:2 [Acaulospora colombiana]